MLTVLKETLKHRNTQKPEEGPGHHHLNAFVGHWRMEGFNFPRESGGQPERVVGEETYEWFDGEYFLINHFDRSQESGRFTGMGWIGYDACTGKYLSYSITNSGLLRIYELEVFDGEIKFNGELERALFYLSPDGNTMEVQWDYTEDGKIWSRLCELKGHRLN